MHAEGFAKDGSAKVGVTERAINQDVAIATGIPQLLHDELRDTDMADSREDLCELVRSHVITPRHACTRAPLGPVFSQFSRFLVVSALGTTRAWDTSVFGANASRFGDRLPIGPWSTGRARPRFRGSEVGLRVGSGRCRLIFPTSATWQGARVVRRHRGIFSMTSIARRQCEAVLWAFLTIPSKWQISAAENPKSPYPRGQERRYGSPIGPARRCRVQHASR